MQRIITAALLASVLAACSTKPAARKASPAEEEPAPPPAAETPTAGAGAPTARDVTVNLDDADGDTLVRVLGTMTGKPVNVDPDAEKLLGCVVVTVHTGGQVKVAKAVSAVTDALRAKGLVVTETATSFAVHRAPDAPPCRRQR